MSAEQRQEAEEHQENQSPKPFTLAARFPSEQTAGRAYFGAQEAVFNSPRSEVSVYRFQLSHIYHVAVLGETPPEPLEQRLRRLLARGELVTLPDDILKVLFQRRAAASSRAPWIERHYRPGMPL